jgi:hypothetical protein
MKIKKSKKQMILSPELSTKEFPEFQTSVYFRGFKYDESTTSTPKLVRSNPSKPYTASH